MGPAPPGDVRENVRVAVRVRPPLSREVDSDLYRTVADVSSGDARVALRELMIGDIGDDELLTNHVFSFDYGMVCVCVSYICVCIICVCV